MEICFHCFRIIIIAVTSFLFLEKRNFQDCFTASFINIFPNHATSDNYYKNPSNNQLLASAYFPVPFPLPSNSYPLKFLKPTSTDSYKLTFPCP